MARASDAHLYAHGVFVSFRQHNKDPESVWRKKHREEFLRNGMPDFVLDNDRRWNYVLLHGADDFQSCWDPSWITPEQAANMLQLLGSRYPTFSCFDLLRELEKRTNAKPGA